MSNKYLETSSSTTEVKPRICWLEFPLRKCGLSLTPRFKSTLGHFIHHVTDRSPASEAGLTDRDRILQVNGIDVSDVSCEEVTRMIEDGRQADVVVTDYLTTDNTTITTSNMIGAHFMESTDGNPRTCRINFPAPAFGFTLQRQFKSCPGHFIGRVEPNSLAFYAGLKNNEKILKVNGEDVSTVPRADVLKMIGSGKQASLTVVDCTTTIHLIQDKEKSSIDEDLIGAVGGQQRKNKNRSSAQQKPSPANRKPINLMTLPLTLQTHDPSTDEEAKEEKPEEKLSFAAVCKKPAKVLPKKKICPFEMTEDLKKRVPSSYTQLLLNPPSVSGHIKDIKLQSKKHTTSQFEGLKLVSGPSGFANYGYLNFFDKYEDEYWLEINAKEQDDDPDRKRDFMLKRIRELRIKKIYPSIEEEFDHLYDEWVRACKMQPRVGSFLLNEDCTQCLVIQEKNGNWGVPKGRLMFDEAPFSGIVREVHEESGIDLLSEGAFMDKVIQHGKYTLSVVRGIEVKPARTYSAFYEPEIIG